MAQEQASEFGTSVTEMIQGFGCFRNNKEKPTDSEIGVALYAGKDDGYGVLNALAWYAGEEVARAYCDAFDRRPVATGKRLGVRRVDEPVKTAVNAATANIRRHLHE